MVARTGHEEPFSTFVLYRLAAVFFLILLMFTGSWQVAACLRLPDDVPFTGAEMMRVFGNIVFRLHASTQRRQLMIIAPTPNAQRCCVQS